MADVANSQPDLHKTAQEEGTAGHKKDDKVTEKPQQKNNND